MWVVTHLTTRCSLFTRKEKNHRFPAFFLEENKTIAKMSIFPKISLRLEVEKYLKEGFMNKEVGQINLLDDICKNSNTYTLWRNRKKKKKRPKAKPHRDTVVSAWFFPNVKTAGIFPVGI